MLFLVSVSLIVLAFYFDVHLPTRENALLRARLNAYRAQDRDQQRFIIVLESTRRLIDSIGKPGVNNPYFASLIGAKLKEMANQDSSLYSGIDKSMITAFLSYEDVKNQLVDLKDAPQQIGNLSGQLRQCEVDRDQARRDVELYRKAGSQSY
jgi:hypothetical protein